MSGIEARVGLLRDRRVAGFVAARALSSLASQMQVVALGWQLYGLTGSAFSLGLLGAAQFVPVVCLVFVAGHVLDRVDRARVARLCQAAEMAGAVALAVAAARHALSPGLIYAVVALFGAARAFEQPAMQSLLPALVPRERFGQAAALSSSLFTSATIVGPSLGGLLYGLGPEIPYAAAALSFAAANAGLAAIGRTAGGRAADGRPTDGPGVERRPPVTWRGVFGGIAFIRSRPEIGGAITLDLFAVLLGGATALLPVYARDILHAGPVGLGFLRASTAAGALVVSLLLARRPLRGHAGAIMFASVGLFGIATIVFGLSRSLPLSVAALAVAGGADVVSVVIRSTLVQLRTPDEMRGRVAAVNVLFIGSSNQLGEFETGMLASVVGAVPAVVLGGIGTLGVVAAFAWLFPGLRRLDRID